MNSNPPQHPENLPDPPPGDPGAFTQEVRHSHVSARVPEKVSRGVLTTGALVAYGPHELIIDFVLRMAQPHQIVARVVMPHTVMPLFLHALRENLNLFQSKFGPPAPLPVPAPPPNPPTIEDIYGQLKLPDDMLNGSYCNAVLIAHSPAEFCFDFITNFYPRSVVSCRVYMAAQQVPGLLNTLNTSYQQYLNKHGGGQLPRPGPPGPSS